MTPKSTARFGFFTGKLATTAICALVLGVATASVVSAISIDSYTFGALEARHIGPAVMSGRVMAIDAVNTDSRTIYVGSASGGIWKSVNGGTTFKPIFDKYTQSIGAVAIDQAHPDTVWVGTGESCVRNSVSVGTGLYRTTDGGENWEEMGLKNSERIARIVVNPANSNLVYVAALGHQWNSGTERGLYRTIDGGKTWERTLYVDSTTGCADIAIEPKSPNILYAAMWEFRRWPYFFSSGGKGSGLYKSIDSGKTWRKLNKGLPSGNLGRIGLAVALSRPGMVYAVVESEKNGLYRSDDFGETWKQTNTSFNVQARPFYFSHVAVDPVDSFRVYKPGVTLSVSDDGGESFTSPFRGGGDIHSDLHTLWINPKDPMQVMVGTDGGVYLSHDKGNTWNFVQNLPLSQFYHVTYDMEFPYNVYGGLQDNGCWVGPSRSPGGIQNKDWRNVGGGDGFCVIPDPTDKDIIYWEYQGGSVNRRHESSQEIKEIQPAPGAGEPELRFNWNTPLATSPTNPHTLYIGSQYLYRTSNRGESWERISPDLTTNDPKKKKQEESGGITIDNSSAENHCTIVTISESPKDPKVIWVGTDDGNIQLTQDGGQHWTNTVAALKGLPKCTWCTSIEPSHFDRGTAYATFDGHQTGDMKTYLFRTTDFGKSWISLTNDSIKGYAHVIREDLVKPNLLFLGTEFGLYVSVDAGTQWARFTGNFPAVAVYDIAIHPRESDLIVATHGRGIMIVDDITPLRQITSSVLEADAYMLSSRPTPIRIPMYEQEFPGDAEFAGRNPAEVAAITYYLKQRHVFGDLRVEVYDSTGAVINRLPGGKRRGLNRVLWFMRQKPPKVAPAATLGGGALFGPTVPEGTYTVKVIRSKDTLVGKVAIVADPKSPHSAEERALQASTVRKLYGMQEQLAYTAEACTDARDQAQTLAKGIPKGDALKKSLTRFADQLDSLHKTLVATKPSWLSGERQLRERIIELYGGVSSFGGRPSQTQLDHLTVLEKEVAKADVDYHGLLGQLSSLNPEVEKKKLQPIKPLSKEDYDKKQ